MQLPGDRRFSPGFVLLVRWLQGPPMRRILSKQSASSVGENAGGSTPPVESTESIPASAPEATSTLRFALTPHGSCGWWDTEFVSSTPGGFACGNGLRWFLGSWVMNDMATGEVSPGSSCLCGLFGTSEVAEHLRREWMRLQIPTQNFRWRMPNLVGRL